MTPPVPDASYTTHRVPTRHGTLRVFARGTGSTLVLLPGIGRPCTDLQPLANLLNAAGYRVLLPEPRGWHPDSGPLRDLTLHDLAADVAAAITALDAAPAVVVGHAFGNRVARTLAADRPELVAAVALLSCSGKVPHDAAMAEANRLALAADVAPEARRAAACRAWFGPGADPTPWLAGWNMEVRAACAAAAHATPLAQWWTAGSAPVLIVQGREDFSAPAANGRLLEQELGARATLVELPGVGHSLPVEAPEAVAATLLAYLRDAPPEMLARAG